MKQWHPITNTTFLSECKIVYYSILRKLPSLSSMKSQSFISTLMKTFLQEMLLLHVVLRQNYVVVTCLICKFIGGDYLISVVFRCWVLYSYMGSCHLFCLRRGHICKLPFKQEVNRPWRSPEYHRPTDEPVRESHFAFKLHFLV